MDKEIKYLIVFTMCILSWVGWIVYKTNENTISMMGHCTKTELKINDGGVWRPVYDCSKKDK